MVCTCSREHETLHAATLPRQLTWAMLLRMPGQTRAQTISRLGFEKMSPALCSAARCSDGGLGCGTRTSLRLPIYMTFAGEQFDDCQMFLDFQVHFDPCGMLASCQLLSQATWMSHSPMALQTMRACLCLRACHAGWYLGCRHVATISVDLERPMSRTFAAKAKALHCVDVGLRLRALTPITAVRHPSFRCGDVGKHLKVVKAIVLKGSCWADLVKLSDGRPIILKMRTLLLTGTMAAALAVLVGPPSSGLPEVSSSGAVGPGPRRS